MLPGNPEVTGHHLRNVGAVTSHFRTAILHVPRPFYMTVWVTCSTLTRASRIALWYIISLKFLFSSTLGKLSRFLQVILRVYIEQKGKTAAFCDGYRS